MKIISTMDPTDSGYLGSLQNPFFKSIAEQVIPSSPEELASPSTRFDGLEMAVRRQLLLMAMEQQQNNGADDEIIQAMGNFWKSSLDLCHHLVYNASKHEPDPRYKDMNARRLPVLLISDCLDALPSLSACQQFWNDFVEPALDSVLFGDLFWRDEKSVCHLPFLKVCNQFLKALQTSAENTVEWKGRIMWELAKGFSIADKSSLKLWGTFHTSNTTEFESQTEFDDQDDKKMIAVASSSVGDDSPTIDYSLYEAFWSLQRDFSNPNRIQVGDFIKKLRLVLAALESAASTQASTSVASPAISTQKYLTSSALLPRQLADPSFRTSVVTQFLIVASHLSSESSPLKNALSSLLARARKLLQTDNPGLYEVVWDGILSNGREDDWRQWKKQKCPAKVFEPQYKRKTVNDDGGPKQKTMRLMDGPLGGNESKNKGSSEDIYKFIGLDELKKISKESRSKIPTLEQHLKPYVEALDPEAGIEDEYHPKNDSVFTWRAMRLFSKHQLPYLRTCRSPADLERITRQFYEDKGQTIPGEMPPENEGISEDEEYDDKNRTEKEEDEDRAFLQDEDNLDGDESQNYDSQDEHVQIENTEEIEHDEIPADEADSQSRSQSQSQPTSEDEREGGDAPPLDVMDVDEEQKAEEPAMDAVEDKKAEEPENDKQAEEPADEAKDESESKLEAPSETGNEKDESEKAMQEPGTDEKESSEKKEHADIKKETIVTDPLTVDATSAPNPQDNKRRGKGGRNSKGPSPRNAPGPGGTSGGGGGGGGDKSSPRSGGRRGGGGNEGGRDRDRRVDGPPPSGRRGDRSDETLRRGDRGPPRTEGLPHRGGRGDLPPRGGGGRQDDDYRGDGRQRGEGGPDRGPRDDQRGPGVGGGPDRGPRDDQRGPGGGGGPDRGPRDNQRGPGGGGGPDKGGPPRDDQRGPGGGPDRGQDRGPPRDDQRGPGGGRGGRDEYRGGDRGGDGRRGGEGGGGGGRPYRGGGRRRR